MDQAQQKALHALEPYVLLAKSANASHAATQVVVQATSAPNTYVFTELLQTPNIQALQTASPEHASYFTLLQIFSWGTWQDYKTTPNLPPLSDAQTQKLRQLSLVTLSTTPELPTYQSLQDLLSLPSTRALEDLVISAIYAGLITAKLDTLAQRVDVSSVAPLRDLRPGSIPEMVSVLDDWDKRCVGVLEELEGQVKEVRRNALREKRRAEANEKAMAKLMEDKENRGKGGGKRGVGDEGDDMDLDENSQGMRSRGAKRGGVLLKGLGRKFGGGGG